MEPNWVIAIATLVATVAGIIGLCIALCQLSNLKETLKINGLIALLDLESQMIARKETLDKVSTKIRMVDAEDEKASERFSEVFNDEHKAALENYLNSIDRLCYCISKGYFKERDWKTEYRTMIQRAIEGNQEEFGAGSSYRNMIDLNNKWQRE